MKRPEGFDPATRGRGTPEPAKPAPKAAPKPKVKPQSPSTSQVPKPRARKDPAVAQVRSAATREQRTVIRADREARAGLRSAARERRRYERGEVRRFTRRARNRRIGWLTAAGVVVILGAMLAIAVYSPILALRTVTVEGAKRVDATQITAAVSDQLGTPLALINFTEITQKLGAFPLIRSYVTETVPPNSLVIHIEERQPIGVRQDGAVWDLIDPAGIVIEQDPTLPTGQPIIDVGAATTDSAAFTSAVAVLLSLPADLRSQVQSISATTADDVTFVFTGAVQRVVWGSSERAEVKTLVLRALIKKQKKTAKVEYNVASPESPFVTQLELPTLRHAGTPHERTEQPDLL